MHFSIKEQMSMKSKKQAGLKVEEADMYTHMGFQ